MKEKKNKGSKIFKEAEKLFEKYGYRKVSIDDIVKKAGVGKGTFYLYFKTKDELYNKIIKNYYNLAEELVAKIVKKNETEPGIIFYKDIMYGLLFIKEKEILKEIIRENPKYYSETVNIEKIIEISMEFTGSVYGNEVKEARRDIPLEDTIRIMIMMLVSLIDHEKDCSDEEFWNLAENAAKIMVDGFFSQKIWNKKKLKKVREDIMAISGK